MGGYLRPSLLIPYFAAKKVRSFGGVAAAPSCQVEILSLVRNATGLTHFITAYQAPADGHTIHVLAPHMIDGKVMGPYHHYCKAVSAEVLECLIYESAEPNALVKQVEYFVAKSVTRPNVPLATWNKFYHDHAVEIATGRVQVLDQSPEDAKKTAEAAAQTDGIIFHLWWPDDAKAPSGEVKHPQSVGHKPRTQ